MPREIDIKNKIKINYLKNRPRVAVSFGFISRELNIDWRTVNQVINDLVIKEKVEFIKSSRGAFYRWIK